MAAPIDPEVQRSLDRLSRTMRSQRQGIAKSLGNLQEELTALVELSPNKKSDDLMAMRNSLNSAKREESAEMSFTQAQKFKIELQHANDEVSRRSAQARSLELQLKAKRGGEAELGADGDGANSCDHQRTYKGEHQGTGEGGGDGVIGGRDHRA